MWKTQKNYEELVTVRNEQDPTRTSGGISSIPVYEETGIYAVMLPDEREYVSTPDGSYYEETVYAQVRKDEMDKVDMIPGKTKMIWDGNSYRVIEIIDYRTKYKFKNAEITLVRHLDVDGGSAW